MSEDRPGRWQGSHRGRAAWSSPPPSQGLRKRHRPSGEVQFAETAPDPGGSGGQAGDAEQQAAPQGRGGRREGERGGKGDGTETRKTNTDRLRPTRGTGRRTAGGRTSGGNIHINNKQTSGAIRPRNRGHKRTQRGRRAQPLRAGAASAAKFDHTGKTQASAERPTSPATPRRLRKPITIRPRMEDAN